MSKWSLPELLTALSQNVEHDLGLSRAALNHPVAKGDASEGTWLELLQKYLPHRYQVAAAHVVDSKGNFSDQIDVLVFDRQYTPFIFELKGQLVVPAESIYAAFEVKQSITADHVRYAGKKVASVRKLHRTSLPIPYAKGTYPPKPPPLILGGLLTFESSWNPPLGDSLRTALNAATGDEHLDLGGVAARGYFEFDASAKQYELHAVEKSVTAFLFKLISKLQFSGTVPMIDVGAYAKWLR